MPALGICEHGNIFEWVHKKEAIESAGMKYIHCAEVYLTEDNGAIGETKGDYIKNQDNYHCVLIAKNYDGVLELNKLLSKSYNRDDFHFYYKPRISFDELFSTSDNIIVTSACLGGVLNEANSKAKERFLAFLKKNKNRCFLELQHHNCQEQMEYNRLIIQLSREIDVPLITGTDTHALNNDHMDGRAMLQMAKDVHFANEDAWDLTFKTTDELIEAYKKQNAVPLEIVYEAIKNTIVMSDMVEEFKLDYSPKYPKLYDNSESVFKQKINKGVVDRGIKKLPNYKEYVDRIHEEYDTYKHNDAIDFMLLEEDYKSEMRKKGVKFGYSRGSVSGSIIAYLLGITEVDSVKYHLNFGRFMNKERVSLADIDTDWFSEDREIVKDYLYSKKGLYCCDIVTFNTIALKGAIKDICRGMYKYNMDKLPQDIKDEVKRYQNSRKKSGFGDSDTNLPASLKEKLEKEYARNAIYKYIPYDYIKFAESLITLTEDDEKKARDKYPEIFRYVDLVNGCVVSVGNHPAACVVSPFPVDEWFGTFTTTGDKYPISFINMKEVDSLNFVKLDILGLDNIGLIYKTCELAGIPFLTPDNVPADDMAVWNSIKDDTTMIFQWESQSATDYLKRLFSNNTISRIKERNPNLSYMDLLSIGNGAIRPAGASYRDKLAQGIYQDNGHEALNEFLVSTLGYLVYQEQVIDFLHSFCGYTIGEADIVRRGFAKKTGTDKFIPEIKAGFNKTMIGKYNILEEESNKLIVNFIKVIEDASSYLFSKNHADPYSWIGYICGYLRYYYPLEFITAALNIFEDKEAKSLSIIEYAKKNGIKISPIKFRYSTAKYNYDKANNEIFKGIASIKHMNGRIADEIYGLRNNQYDSFIDLLYDIFSKTSTNARQLKILIELDFFSEFGDTNLLLEQYKYYDTFYDRSQLRKEELSNFGISLDIIRPYVGRETDKMLMDIDMKSFIKASVGKIEVPCRKLSEQLKSQIKYLGYVTVVNQKYSRMAVVLDIDTKYSPKLKLYSLKNGTTIDCKVSKRIFNKEKLIVGDMLKIASSEVKPKSKKNQNGDWEIIPGTREVWINSYKKIP